MYTLIKRTVPPPTMSIFDASNRDFAKLRVENQYTFTGVGDDE
jgi:hypothetical protein